MKLHDLPTGCKFTLGMCVYEAGKDVDWTGKRGCRKLLYSRDNQWFVETGESWIWFDNIRVKPVTIKIEVAPCT